MTNDDDSASYEGADLLLLVSVPKAAGGMDIFHAERRSTDSTFRIETNIECFTPIG